MVSTQVNCAWATLMASANYLPGLLVLAHTLRKHHSAYPLIVMATPDLPESILQAIRLEQAHNPLIKLQLIQKLNFLGSKSQMVHERFAHTWTKLRVFQLVEYHRVAFLDMDTLVCRNMDEIFENYLPGPDWIAGPRDCKCQLHERSQRCYYDSITAEAISDHDCDHQSSEYHFTPRSVSGSISPSYASTSDYTLQLNSPGSFSTASTISSSASTTSLISSDGTESSQDPPSFLDINSGVFLISPSPSLRDEIEARFNCAEYWDELASYKFPDQDFLLSFFKNRVATLPWQYNAIKPLRYWHPEMWNESEANNDIRLIHYVIDKPWGERVSSDGIAGKKGRDGPTHTLWWSEFEEWKALRGKASPRERQEFRAYGKEQGQNEEQTCDAKATEDKETLLALLHEGYGPGKPFVAPELDAVKDAEKCKENAKNGFPVPVNLSVQPAFVLAKD